MREWHDIHGQLRELLDEKELTPKRFAGHFARFDYEFGVDVLQADVFLARRKGDCDDGHDREAVAPRPPELRCAEDAQLDEAEHDHLAGDGHPLLCKIHEGRCWSPKVPRR